MVMQKWLNWGGRSLVAGLLCLVCLVTLASGYGKIDTGKTVALTLRYADNGGQTPLKGMELALYRVAAVTSSGRFDLSGTGFRDSQVVLNGDVSWPNLATTLYGYLQEHREAISPEAEGSTDEDGRFHAALPVGLYLVTGKALTIGQDTYTPTPFLLALPQLDEEDQWQYEVEETLLQKYDHTHRTNGRTLNITVEKVWSGEEGLARPAEVQVKLARNGANYATVTLSQENGWSHTWRGLSRTAEWTVTEEVPEGYTVEVERSQSGDRLKFTVRNTYFTPPTPTPSVTPTPSATPTPSEPVPGVTPSAAPVPSEVPVETPVQPNVVPESPTPTPQPEEEPGEKLPQTGLAWYPALIFAGVGCVMVVAGTVMRKRHHE